MHFCLTNDTISIVVSHIKAIGVELCEVKLPMERHIHTVPASPFHEIIKVATQGVVSLFPAPI